MGLSSLLLQLPPPAQSLPGQATTFVPQLNLPDLSQTGFFGILPPLAYLFTALLFIFGMIMLIRWRQNDTSYYGTGHRITGRYLIGLRGTGQFHCRLTQVDPLVLEEALEIVKKIPEIMVLGDNAELAINDIINRIHKKTMFLYQVKIIDRKYVKLRGNLGFGTILSTANLNDPKYYYDLQKGIGRIRREDVRVVDCLRQSRKFDLLSASRKLTPVFVIYPTPDPEENKEIILSPGFDSFDVPPVIMKVITMANPKDIAQIMLILQTTADLYSKIELKTRQVEGLTKMIKQAQGDTIEKAMEADYLRGELGQQELEKIGTKEIQKLKEPGWIWVFVTIFVGIMSYVLQQNVPQLSTISPIVAFLIGSGAVIIVKAIVERKSDSPEERMKNRQLQVSEEMK